MRIASNERPIASALFSGGTRGCSSVHSAFLTQEHVREARRQAQRDPVEGRGQNGHCHGHHPRGRHRSHRASQP